MLLLPPSPRSLPALAALLLAVVVPGSPGRAEMLIPGPGETGHDAALAALAHTYDRQFLTFNAAPYSMSLDVHIPVDDLVSRGAVSDFLADAGAGLGPDAFQTYSGMEVFDVVEHYGEIGDLGMFGGMGAGGEALRYAVIRERCASLSEDCDLAAAARANVHEILEVMHVAHAITGDQGVVARGLFKRGMPRRGGDPLTIPLRDAGGNPNPPCDQKPENPSLEGAPGQQLRFREDATQSVPGEPQSGRFPDWIWMDNASKDQLTGWVYAMGIVYDVVQGDPDIPDALVTRLRDDAARMGRRLMRPVGLVADTPSTPGGDDMAILDGDGCLTTFHDVNAEEVEGNAIGLLSAILGAGIQDPVLKAEVQAFRNAFNALLGLAAMRTFCHISGASDVCAFYYDELVGTRRWHEMLIQTPIPIDQLPMSAQDFLADLGFPADLPTLGSLGIDLDHLTNYSNVNMAFMGFFGVLRYEPDPALRAVYQQALEESLWDTGIDPRQPSVLSQSFFDFIYAAFRAEGTDGEAVARGTATLSVFATPPYWNDAVENCDAAEEAAGTCTAIDDVTMIEIAPSLGRGGALVAVDPVPKEIRPPSNFEWRSNPYAVNGGGGDRLNPAGDFRGAYWLGRVLVRGDGRANLSPLAVPEPGAAAARAAALLAMAALARWRRQTRSATRLR